MATRKNSSTGRKTKKEQMQEIERAEALQREIALWGIVAVSLLLFISNLGFGGAVGGAVSGVLFGIFGMVAYIFPILLLVGSFFAISNRGNSIAIIKLFAVSFFAIFICVFLSLAVYGDNVATPLKAFSDSMSRKSGGGIIGGSIGYFLVKGFGIIGAYIIDVIMLIVSLVVITGKSAMKGMKKQGQKMYATAKENNVKVQEYRVNKSKERAARRMDKKVKGVSLDTKIVDKASAINTDEMGEIHIENYPTQDELFPIDNQSSEVLPNDNVKEISQAEDSFINKLFKEAQFVGDSGTDTKLPIEEEKVVAEIIKDNQPQTDMTEIFDTQPKIERESKKKISVEEKQSQVDSVERQIKETNSKQKSTYIPPSIDILHKGEPGAVGNTKQQLAETAAKLEQTMNIFGVNARVTDYSCGPTVTRFEVQPELGVKVSKIVNLTDDIKFSLAATDVRIEAPIPGKSAVGIEIPNAQNVAVPFRDLVESKEFKEAKSPITFALGRDISGAVKIADLAKMPHLMIAGSTGSGKSVCINTIITSILYKAGPEDVKLIMIDPKVVELSVYNGIPHLLIPVVTDPKKAAGALNWAVKEMTDRYQKFAETGVREINGYNEKVDLIEVPEGQERPKKMERIVVIVDELADLMMVAAKDVEEAICRLAQLARAAGIHLIIATQRPSADVITGIIRANMPSRIAFAVSSAIDSRIILDQAGAERLLGKGDMLFNPQGATNPMRIQGAFITDNEISQIIDDVKAKNGEAQADSEIENQVSNMQTSSNMVAISDGENDDGRDNYFMEAASIIVDKEKASIGMLQRYLKVGFNRAARIMDQLEEAGIVGPEEGTKPRKVLMSQEEFDSFVDENS